MKRSVSKVISAFIQHELGLLYWIRCFNYILDFKFELSSKRFSPHSETLWMNQWNICCKTQIHLVILKRLPLCGRLLLIIMDVKHRIFEDCVERFFQSLCSFFKKVILFTLFFPRVKIKTSLVCFYFFCNKKYKNKKV